MKEDSMSIVFVKYFIYFKENWKYLLFIPLIIAVIVYALVSVFINPPSKKVSQSVYVGTIMESTPVATTVVYDKFAQGKNKNIVVDVPLKNHIRFTISGENIKSMKTDVESAVNEYYKELKEQMDKQKEIAERYLNGISKQIEKVEKNQEKFGEAIDSSDDQRIKIELSNLENSLYLMQKQQEDAEYKLTQLEYPQILTLTIEKTKNQAIPSAIIAWVLTLICVMITLIVKRSWDLYKEEVE